MKIISKNPKYNIFRKCFFSDNNYTKVKDFIHQYKKNY